MKKVHIAIGSFAALITLALVSGYYLETGLSLIIASCGAALFGLVLPIVAKQIDERVKRTN